MLRTLVLALALFAGVAQATDATMVKASNGWLRVLPGNLPSGGYATFENTSDKALSIVSAKSDAYGDVMVHRSTHDGGTNRMEMVDKVALPPKSTVSFEPGGYHVMLMQPKHAVQPGDTITVTFTLSDGETIPVEMLARPANATGR